MTAMCENDAAVDAWFRKLNDRAWHVADGQSARGPGHEIYRAKHEQGHMRGVIRELAATVPGVREWLIEHMPGEG